MPHTGRGGRRQGKPGVAYQNRTDLNAQPIRTAPGQTYGVAAAQEAAQRLVPLPAETPLPTPTPLGAPSQRPLEPVTAGMLTGAGSSTDALMLPPGSQLDVPLEMLRHLLVQNPYTPELKLLFSLAEQSVQ